MAPPHLHPRSKATSTLFAGTLLASFVVVAAPHIWPCPRPRKVYMDGEAEIVYDEQGRAMRRVRRLRRAPAEASEDAAKMELTKTTNPEPQKPRPAEKRTIPSSTSTSGAHKHKSMQEEVEILRKLQAEAELFEQENARRPCPVPKPRGVVGRFLGFEESKHETKAQVDQS